MEEQRLMDDVLSYRMHRRDMLRRAATLGLSVPAIGGLLAACGGGDDDDDGDATATTAGAATEPAGGAATEPSGGAATEPSGDDATPTTGGGTGAATTTTGGSGGEGQRGGRISAFEAGNVAQFTGGLMGTHHGGMGKRLLAGKAAHSGTLAAQLAAHGFTNVDNIFECGYGSFPTAFSGARDTFDLEKLRAGFGTEYRSFGANFKVWAARVPIHPSLEAIKTIRQERTLNAEDIERVDVALPEGSFKAVGFDYHPTTITSAQLNLQYCIAIMLHENDVFIEQFTEEKIAAPHVLDMVSRIHIRHDPSLDNAPSGTIARDTLIDITLKNGDTIQQRGQLRGYEGNPVTYDEVVAKFRKTSRNRISESEQEQLIDLCGRLDTLPDARVLLAPLAKSQVAVAAS